MTMKNLLDAKNEVVRRYRLEALQKPVPLEILAKNWGVVSIKTEAISSDGMLLPGRRGYTIILNQSKSRLRRRFSLAHEMSHLLLQKCGISNGSAVNHRGSDESDGGEERLCDEIAAEILMPRLAFEEDAWMEGWSLRSLRILSREYETSMTATARRMVELMPEPALMSVWKPPNDNGDIPKLQWTDIRRSHHRVQNASFLPRERLRLITDALDSDKVESGCAPVVDTRRGAGRPTDVPAEALAWGRGEYRQVMVFYYPLRSQTGKFS